MNSTSSSKVPASILLLVTLLAAWPAQAEVPNFVTYSGRLTDGTAWGESTQADLTFWLCQQAEGDVADCVWTESLAGAQLEDGYFAVTLGQTSPLPAPLPAAAWLAVAVDNGPPLVPRQQVGSVPYALQAGNAASIGEEQQTLADLDGRYVLEGQGTDLFVDAADPDGDEMSGPLSLPLIGLTVGGIQLVTAGGNVGIGTTEPKSLLHIRVTNSYIYLDKTTVEGGHLWSIGAGAVFNNNTFSIQDLSIEGYPARFFIGGDGQVGIGTTSPAAELDVAGATPEVRVTNTEGRYSWIGQYDQGGAVTLNDAAGNDNVIIRSHGKTHFNGGNVGIGTTQPSAKLHVAGNVKADDYLYNSSRVLKDGIEALSEREYGEVLEQLKRLALVRFRFKHDGADAKRHLGVIAEDSPPQILSKDGKSVSLSDYVSFVAAAVKAMAVDNDRLRLENEALRSRLGRVEQRHSELERRLLTLERR